MLHLVDKKQRQHFNSLRFEFFLTLQVLVNGAADLRFHHFVLQRVLIVGAADLHAVGKLDNFIFCVQTVHNIAVAVGFNAARFVKQIITAFNRNRFFLGFLFITVMNV